MAESLICTWCGRGPFVRMETHLNKCAAAKRRGEEADAAFREPKRQGLPMALEPAWKRRRFELVEEILEEQYDPPQGDSDGGWEMQEDITSVGNQEAQLLRALDGIILDDITTGADETSQTGGLPNGGPGDFPRRSRRLMKHVGPSTKRAMR